ncbi:MAG: hypothetical protein ACE5GG_00490 [Candidatus Omnitrophota bacterium]
MNRLEARILPVGKARDPSTGWVPRGVPIWHVKDDPSTGWVPRRSIRAKDGL